MNRFSCILLSIALCCCPLGVQAQEGPDVDPAAEASRQMWFNYMIGMPRSERLYLELDVEAATQVNSNLEPWRYLYTTGLVEYYPNGFIDLTGELVGGYTKQSVEEDSLEATVRLGIRLHLINQILSSSFLEGIRPERISTKRFAISNLSRLEARNFWYTGGRPSASDYRFRNRLETKFALNRPSLADDGGFYLLADLEFFVPLSNDEAAERFATKRRARLGLGYRYSYDFRFDVLLMRDHARDTREGEATVDAYMVDLRFRWFL